MGLPDIGDPFSYPLVPPSFLINSKLLKITYEDLYVCPHPQTQVPMVSSMIDSREWKMC